MSLRAALPIGVGLGVGLLVSACFPEAQPVDCPEQKPSCCQNCQSDVGVLPACRSGKWVCPIGSVDSTSCEPSVPQCTVAQSDGGQIPDSSLRPCADSDAGLCLSGCDLGEVCLTQVTCGPAGDAGTCTLGGSTPGDDRCHRSCEADAGCGPGENCFSETFFACSDFNAPRLVCCATSNCL